MPRIPVYEQRTTPQGSASPGQTYQGATLGGLARLGDAAERLDYTVQRRRELAEANAERKRQADGITRIHARLTEGKAQWLGNLAERQRQTTDGADGFTGQFLKDFDGWVAEVGKFALTEEAKLFAEEQLGQMRADLTLRAKNFEAEQGIKYRASLYDSGLDSSRIAVAADPDGFESALATNAEVLKRAALPGEMTRAKFDQTRTSLAAAAVGSLVDRDPQKMLAALRAKPGESGIKAVEALSPEQRLAYQRDAKMEIRRREAEARAAAAEARANALAQSAILKDETDNALRQYSLGFGLPKHFGQLLSAVDALPADDPRRSGMQETLAVLESLDQNGFLQLTPAQQRDWATGLETTIREQGANPASLTLLETAKKIQGETERRAKEDPYRFALERGVVKPPAETGDIVQDLTARAAAGRQASAYLGRPVPGFTRQELDNLADRYQKGGVEERLALLTTLNKTHGQEQAGAVFEALDQQNQGVMALSGVLASEDPAVARLVVRGQVAAKETPGLVPSTERIQPEIDGQLRDAYGLGTSARRSVEVAIKAAYAALAAEAGDTSGEVDAERLQAAVQAVTGGLIQYGGRTMPAPQRGVTQAQFSRWAEGLAAPDFQGVAGLTPEQAETAYRRDGALVAIGANRYGIAIEGPDGRQRLLVGTDGNPLALSYRETPVRRLPSRNPEAPPTLDWAP